jgi:hypothetical protein
MGHSSGAHISSLMLLEQVRQVFAGTKKKDDIVFDSFVGISGPYDISHHFDYEAARGVEEISPMKAACGYSRQSFRWYSPALRLKQTMANIKCASLNDVLPAHMLVVHGIEDDVVPFTATSEFAKILQCCAGHCQEIYVAKTGHHDTVLHLMFGGPTRTAIVDWLQTLSQSHSRQPKLIVQSKL